MRRFGWLLALAACGGGDDTGADGVPDTTDTDTPGTGETTPTPNEPFRLRSASIHPPESDKVYLVQQLDVETNHPSTLTARITDGNGVVRTITWTAASDSHAVPILGLHALETYSVEVSVESAEGEVLTAEPIVFQNGPLPEVFPTLDLYYRDPARVEPGYVLAAPWSSGLGRVITVLDDEGVPVWAFVPAGDWKSPNLTARGVAGLQGETVPEISWLGETVHRFAVDPEGDDIPLDFDGLHHEALPLPDGGIYLLSSEPLDISDYPLDYSFTLFGDVTIANHIAHRVTADGTTIETWSMADRIDPRRIGFDSAELIGGTETYDWGHANAIVVDESDDSVLVSMRNQDAIIKFSRATGDIRWIFGQHGGWSPAFQPYLLTPTGDDFQWQGHQHAPALLPGGKMILFDNGNHGRANPYSDENLGATYSRVVQYTIDETNWTAHLDWEWSRTLTGALNSAALGNADPLPQGNVFATFSYLYSEDDVSNEALGRGTVSTRLIQFSPVDQATVFDLAVYGPADTSGWLVDRALWLPTLYGDSATVTVSD
ncbi:MAG: aryl-sulfate sulfotransferase [Deltaproteobacteria bacterium]|nr:aryl-sulfate sulfotransferase [Deltaproteobacteria bacterium]